MAGIIIAIVAFIGVVVFIRYQNSNQLLQEGRIIKRKTAFWEEKQIFELDAPYEEVSEGVKRTDYNGCAVEIHFNYNNQKVIFFKSSNAWNAALAYLGMSEGKHLYSLSFTGWKNNRNGIPYDINSMNIFLTQTEKMLLALDPETMVETRMMELKTKTNFI